jgi:DUF3024 family protein
VENRCSSDCSLTAVAPLPPNRLNLSRMDLPWDVRTRAEIDLSQLCERRVPVQVRHQVRLDFEIRGVNATLVERRVPWRPRSSDEPWTRLAVARFRYDPVSGRWALDWPDRNGRWHAYDRKSTGTLGELLAEIDADPTAIFWG